MFGIPIGLHYSWFVVFLGVTWILAESTFPDRHEDWPQAKAWGAAIVTSVLFFSSVVAHELGHSLVAMRNGIRVKSITLFVFGGVAQISREAPTPLIEGLIAIAGPLVSAALGGAFLGLHLLVEDSSAFAGEVSLYLGQINLMLAVFNMLPGFPLDGGRVFRAIVWGVKGDYLASTRIAAGMGQAIGYLFVAGGVAMAVWTGEIANGLWFSFIGWFLASIAAQSRRQAVLREALKGVRVRDIMNGGAPMIPGSMDLRTLVDRYLSLTDRRCFLVGEGDRWVGLVTVTDLRRVPQQRWSQTRVADVMVPLARVATVEAGDDALRAVELMDEREVSQVPVVEAGVVVGMLPRERIVQPIRQDQRQPKRA